MASDERTEAYSGYCLSAGHLFHVWSRLETTITAALKLHLAGNIKGPMDPKALTLASAIYGGARFSASRDTIKRILKAERAPKGLADFITAVLSQAGHIEHLRNRLSHDVVDFSHQDGPEAWQVTDALNVRDIYVLKVWVFDTNAVLAAGADIRKIIDLISVDLATKSLFSGIRELKVPSWQYRASMLREVPRSKLKTFETTSFDLAPAQPKPRQNKQSH